MKTVSNVFAAYSAGVVAFLLGIVGAIAIGVMFCLTVKAVAGVDLPSQMPHAYEFMLWALMIILCGFPSVVVNQFLDHKGWLWVWPFVLVVAVTAVLLIADEPVRVISLLRSGGVAMGVVMLLRLRPATAGLTLF